MVQRWLYPDKINTLAFATQKRKTVAEKQNTQTGVQVGRGARPRFLKEAPAKKLQGQKGRLGPGPLHGPNGAWVP